MSQAKRKQMKTTEKADLYYRFYTHKINKVTPLYDLSWYIKWTASFFILTAVACRSTGFLPLWDLWLSLIGTFGWLAVGMLWHDRALTLLNGVLVTILAAGLISHYFGV